MRQPHRQPFFALEPTDPFAVDQPAFSSQHHVQPEIPEAGTGLSHLTQPSPEGDIIAPMVAVVP